MSIELHIERLVVDQTLLAGERGTRVRGAIERELAELLARPGTVEALRGIGAVTALPPARLPPVTQTHDHLGARIAVAVGHGLGIATTTAAGGRHG